MTLASIAGPIAAASGVAMALSPLLQARRVRALGNSSEVSAGVFQMMRTNASIWLTYGLASGNHVVVIPNLCALATTTFTLMTIKRYRHAGGDAPAPAPVAQPQPQPHAAPLRNHAARVRGGALAAARTGRLVSR